MYNNVSNLTENEKTYKTKFNLSDASLSTAQNFSVNPNGTLHVDVPLVSLSLSADNLQITFDKNETGEDHFIDDFKFILDKIKNYTLMNSNNIVQDNKEIIRKIHEKAAQIFTEVNFTIDGYNLWTKF